LLFSVSDGEWTEIPPGEYSGIYRDSPTLASSNIRNDKGELSSQVVQVTDSAAIVLDLNTGLEVTRWTGTIVAASVHSYHICIGVQGGELVYLTFNPKTEKIEER